MSGNYRGTFIEIKSGCAFERNCFDGDSELGVKMLAYKWWHSEGAPPGMLRLLHPDGRCKTINMTKPSPTWTEIRKSKQRRFKRFSKK